jgi:hypothetical protein
MKRKKIAHYFFFFFFFFFLLFFYKFCFAPNDRTKMILNHLFGGCDEGER